MIHKEGYISILLSIVVSIALIALTNACCPNASIIAYLVAAFLIVIVLQFFRNPNRDIKRFDDNLVYAPADGKVVVIEETEETEYFKDKKLLISVFMSPLNVHVNRCSIGGDISYTKYHQGKYLVAWHPKSSTENERNTVVIKNKNGVEILLRQIAGALARRIVSYKSTGDHVKQGEEFGFIKFGSRVDIFLPLSAKVNVKIGQAVAGNIDILAELS
ncbi:MAG: phosphatidylserine decarboxylase family protein [Saprospiraceae bacterium]|nr:phosphatidylserine decarboxylase family protein [Saprospiraceae bacterium]